MRREIHDTRFTASQAETIRLFSQRFRGWQDSNGSFATKQPRWHTNSKLQASIATWLNANSSTDKEDFAKYCLVNLDNNLELLDKHLSAFLENIGYKRAKIIWKTLRERQISNQSLPLENSLEEVYQYAWLAASNPRYFYENFQRESPHLLRYTEVKIKGVIL
ncbi:MAG: hypothetical protein HC907_37180 [Richelia sp. SM1_7_0]|nr:hypothetical protein [Richelia sp. SM1_7_0]